MTIYIGIIILLALNHNASVDGPTFVFRWRVEKKTTQLSPRIELAESTKGNLKI